MDPPATEDTESAPPGTASGAASPPPRVIPPAPTRLTGSDAVKVHLTLAAGLVLCAAAFWFEVARALGGNELSWAYVFEWPLIAGFAVYLWWNVLHQHRGRKRAEAKPAVVAPEHLGMLKAWQEQQRQLSQSQTESGTTGQPPGPHA